MYEINNIIKFHNNRTRIYIYIYIIVATQSWLNRMNRHYIVSNELIYYSRLVRAPTYTMYRYMRVKWTVSVPHAGKKCRQVVRRSWAEENNNNNKN